MIKTKGESDKLYQAEICVNNYTYHLYKIHLVNIILFQRENQDKLIWNKIKNDWFALEKEDFVSWLVQTKSKVHIHTYGYITRTFNRKGERLIHRQRLTSVDRRCSTIFSSSSSRVHCVLTFESAIYSMQVYVHECMYM